MPRMIYGPYTEELGIKKYQILSITYIGDLIMTFIRAMMLAFHYACFVLQNLGHFLNENIIFSLGRVMIYEFYGGVEDRRETSW